MIPADLYYTITEHSPVATFAYDVGSQKWMYANPAFYRLINSDANEPALLATDALVNLIHPEDREYVAKTYQQFLVAQAKKEVEFRLVPQAGQEVWIRVTPFLYQFDGTDMLFGKIVDITSESNNLNIFKKYANKKNSILNILAHDLMGPLSIAKGISELLNKNITDPKLNEQVRIIEDITKEAIDMIRDLTTREFLETTGVDLFKKRIDIVKKLKEYLEESKRAEGISRRKFYFSTSHQSIYVNLDEAKFFQAVNNLISNALKFTKDDGIISIAIESLGDTVLFTVSDDGIGIPDDLQPRVFDKFTTARREGLHGEPTVGLGMSIVKTIIEWHQGRIWIESKENQGTRVYLELPKY